MPFSIGRRSCIGQNLAMLEMRVILANIVKAFDFELEGEMQEELFITLKPVQLKMKFARRPCRSEF